MKILRCRFKEAIVIGVMGRGKSTEGFTWVPPLWKKAEERFFDIEPFVKKDELGRTEMFGAMSDIRENFKPWEDEGLYLAAWKIEEIPQDVPFGWSIWKLPECESLNVTIKEENYGSAFKYIMEEYIPSMGMRLSGAVHEYYAPERAHDELTLIFPIEQAP